VPAASHRSVKDGARGGQEEAEDLLYHDGSVVIGPRAGLSRGHGADRSSQEEPL
jgi:hypothetical protein